MKFNTREPGLLISGVAHATILVVGLAAFSSPDAFPDAQEGIPVEMITENQFSEITRGETTAKEVQATPKPRADRVAETQQLRDPGEAKRDAPAPPTRPAEMAVDDKPVEAAEAPPPTPPARPQPDREAEARAAADAKAAAEKAAQAKAAEAKAAADKAAADQKAKAQELAREKAEAEAIAQAAAEKAREAAEAKAKAAAEAKRMADAKAKAEADAKAKREAEEKRVAEQKRAEEEERIAEAKAAAEAKRQAEAKAEAKRVADAKAKAEAQAKAKREAELADKFNAGDIRNLLRSKETAQSSGATGAEVNKTASLGTATGSASRLNPSQRDALVGLIQSQLRRCWDAPIAAQSAQNPPVPTVRLVLNPDGSLAGTPTVVNASQDPLFRAVADSATRATRRCAPLQIPAQFAPYYQDWKNLTVNFNPLDT